LKIEAIKYSDYKAGQRFGEKKTMKDIGNVLKKAGAATAGSILMFKHPMAPLAATTDINGVAVEASGAVSSAVRDQIIHAFDPLVGLMTDLALPIASVIITGAALMILIGFPEKGYPMMMRSCIGYIAIMLCPMFIKILAGIGAAL
jgi:hypothetical protein